MRGRARTHLAAAPLALAAALVTLAATLACVVPARADTGPKPSVVVTVRGLDGRACYGTLLSKEESNGPASAYVPGTDRYVDEGGGGEEVWQAFQDYQDPDGFYFLQWTFDVGDDGVLDWTYYPPDTFKVALYFPDTGAILTSGVLERTAFETRYTVDLAGVDLSGQPARALPVGEGSNGAPAQPTPELPVEEDDTLAAALPGVALRLVVTVVVELAVMWAFGYRERGLMAFALVVNVVTQALLNAGLAVAGHYGGPAREMLALARGEALVFAAEAALFAWWFGRHDPKGRPRRRAVACALVANAASLAVGLAM